MRRLDPCLAPAGYSPRRYETLSPAPVLGMGERMTDLLDIQALFANGEQGGYWPADPAYLYEDSAGTIPASRDGVVGLWMDQSRGCVAQARRNLLSRTDEFNNAVWASGSSFITPNAGVAPDGSATADLQTITLSSGIYCRYVTAQIPSTIYTLSAFAKAGNCHILRIRNLAIDKNGWFDLSTGVAETYGYLNYSIVAVGDGWYRCSITGTTSASIVNNLIDIQSASSIGSTAGTVGGTIYIWGAQLELGESATPYQKIITGTADLLPGNHAYQQTTANKPYLRRTPVSNKYWLDSNTTTGALTATFASSLGSACTIATVGAEGVTIADNQTITTTYNLTPPYGYNGDVLIINRALTAAEKALVTRTLKRNAPYYPSIVDARLQMRGYAPNNENTVDTSIITNFAYAWYGCSGLTSFPLINTAAGTNFDSAWRACSGLTSFPLINTAAGTIFSTAWAYCSSLTSFPLINTAAGTTFAYAWRGCSGLTSFPANFFDSWTGVPIANCFSSTWDSCIKLTLASVQNIVVSLVVSGKSAPATGTDISLDGAPTLVAIQADTTVMTAVATLKSRNWTPKYKGTAL